MEDIYKQFVEKIKTHQNTHRATVVYMWGDLGSGKTTFTKNLCIYLGLNIDITSPTFTILKKYDFDIVGFKKLIHIDAYRLNSYDDLLKIKFGEYLEDKNNLILIEWPSIIENDSIKPDITIRFEHGDDINNRIITID
jgi:tRNA threonylcarbamoyladenosine biosynthesis protein TsaE